MQYLAGGLVLGDGPARDVDRVGAAAGPADLVFPAGVTGSPGHLQHVAEEAGVQVREGRGVGHAATARSAGAKTVKTLRVIRPSGAVKLSFLSSLSSVSCTSTASVCVA